MATIPKTRIAAYIVGALIAVAGPVTFAALMTTGAGRALPSTPALSIVSAGSAAPDFVLPTHDGRTMHLADYRGRAVFLVFVPDFTSASTIAQVRSLAKSESDFDMAGAKVMVISADSADAAQKLHTTNKLPFPLLLDEDGALARQFGVGTGMRRTFVVSPVGQVKFRIDDSVIDIQNHGKQLIKIGGCCIDDVQASRADGIGKPVGDYSLPLATDPTHPMTTVYGDGKQKATAVLLLSAKCPCSNSYNERIAGFAKRYTGRSDIRLIGIYANKDETIEEIAAHAKEHRFTFPVLRDEDGLCAKHLGASVTPESFVIDSSRNLRYAGRIDDHREVAEAKTHDFVDAVEAIASGKEPPKATRAFGCGIVR